MVKHKLTVAMSRIKRVSKRATMEFVVLVLLVGLGLYTWQLRTDRNNLNQEVASLKSNPQQVIQQQTSDTISSVARLTTLPGGETPQIAVVNDVAAAKAQSHFFNEALDGDRLLLYTKAGEAILYRPSTNTIINKAPLTFSSQAAGTNTTQ